MAKSITIREPARRYENDDNSLSAAATAVALARGLRGWDLDPRWEDNEREIILLDLPEWAVTDDDDRA